MAALIRIIDHLSDKKYQTRVWILGKGPECDDFDDACCNFFLLADPILEEFTEFGITEKQYKVLRSFRDEFDQFSGSNHWAPDFIDSPEWAKIMRLAKDVLMAFNYQL